MHEQRIKNRDRYHDGDSAVFYLMNINGLGLRNFCQVPDFHDNPIQESMIDERTIVTDDVPWNRRNPRYSSVTSSELFRLVAQGQAALPADNQRLLGQQDSTIILGSS